VSGVLSMFESIGKPLNGTLIAQLFGTPSADAKFQSAL
jgi:hypothetical protein